MPAEPAIKRAIAFIDGQNLFYAAKYAFGNAWPNYDPLKLSQAVCRTDWIRIDRAMYDSCLDPRDYRPKGETP